MSAPLKPGVRVMRKGPLFYQLDQSGRPIRYQPWLGDVLTFLYDFFMTRAVFPKKLNASLERHRAILIEACQGFHAEQILEVGTGTGSAAGFLPPGNTYVGSDVSPGLLKQAASRFNQAGFEEAEFYIASGDELPFAPKSFELCLCILALNFIGNHQKFFQGIQAQLRCGGRLLVCVPVPERAHPNSTIHGGLLSEVRLQKLCQSAGFRFVPIEIENGALLYFWAIKT